MMNDLPCVLDTNVLVSAMLWIFGSATALVVGSGLFVAVALAVAYPNLPDISDLSDYRPKLPLRIYSSDGVLIGEFGEERRNLTPIKDIPQVMKDAVLAIEDARFFQHGGVDYLGVVRAGLANFGRAKSQGASTITMQVARNVYLSAEKSCPASSPRASQINKSSSSVIGRFPCSFSVTD